jgi:dTDP-4-dehydrorhamnose reductase
MRILIAGVNGLLGSNLARCLSGRGHMVIGSGRQAQSRCPLADYHPGDLLERAFATRLITESQPEIIINCVGMADVNLCEADPALAQAINARTSAYLASAAATSRKRLIHMSTDHLFSGERPWRTETDTPAPVNEYGRSKLAGENEVLKNHPDAVVVRTNFYGWSPAGHPPTFAEWLYRSLAEKRPIHLYTDYFFNSIEVSYLAAALEEVARSDFHGILNIAGAERCSKYEFGRAMAEVFGLSMEKVQACAFEPKAMQVKRPVDLSLCVDLFRRLFHSPLPTLREGLVRLSHERREVMVGGRP